uniref:Adhesion G protein-coupled receptor E8 n=1 Tax=Sphaeramia orbicularis TaxID=375764 RepID=A0A673B0Z4_9TELE
FAGCLHLISCLFHVLTDIDECERSEGRVCGSNSNCTNTIGSYICTCWNGFNLLFVNITPAITITYYCTPSFLLSVDIDECLDNVCGDGGTCTNNPGSYVCDCHPGFKLVPGQTAPCVDINECFNSTICGPDAICTNTFGALTCACEVGYKNPEMIASFANPCTGNLNNLHICDHIFGCLIINTVFISTDIDECSETPGICGFQTVCTNKPGTFYCSCPDGFYPSTGLRWTVGVSFCKSELRMFVYYSIYITIIKPGVCLQDVLDGITPKESSSLTANGNTMEINMGTLAENNNGEKFKSYQSCQRFVVLLTVSVMLTSPGSAAAAFLTLHGMESLLSHQYFKTENRTEMYSDVITAVLPSVNNTNLTEPVNFTVQHKKVSMNQTKLAGDGMVTCVYWEGGKTSTMRWSVDGCWVAYTTDNYTVCSCSHLSTFALIMQIGEVFQINDFLEWLNRMCVIVGLFFFALAILTFLLCSWNPKINNTARLHLCLSLSLSHLLLLWNEKYLACTVMAGILHFLVVASFVWMQLEAMQLYLLVRRLTKVQVIQRDGLPRPLLYVIGYGVPFVIVGVSALVYSDGYGATEAGACWLSRTRNFNWNIKLFFFLHFYNLILVIYCSLAAIVAQFFILGCTWILGLYQTNLFFQVLFIFLNSQQGTFLFIVHCVLNKEVIFRYILCERSTFGGVHALVEKTDLW